MLNESKDVEVKRWSLGRKKQVVLRGTSLRLSCGLKFKGTPSFHFFATDGREMARYTGASPIPRDSWRAGAMLRKATGRKTVPECTLTGRLTGLLPATKITRQ
jgi:hypothetical protein